MSANTWHGIASWVLVLGVWALVGSVVGVSLLAVQRHLFYRRLEIMLKCGYWREVARELDLPERLWVDQEPLGKIVKFPSSTPPVDPA